jgi:hypothetical protein
MKQPKVYDRLIPGLNYQKILPPFLDESPAARRSNIYHLRTAEGILFPLYSSHEPK